MPDLVLKKSSTSILGRVQINISPYVNGATELIGVDSAGFYLQSNDTNICIVQRQGAIRGLPQIYNAVDYRVDLTQPIIETEVRLWEIRVAEPPPEPPPGPPPLLMPVERMIKLKAIPKKIAWLIADDAKEETCPISTNPISPITAAVTTCFHVFDHDSISEWFARTPTHTCPVCREVCEFTRAFAEV